MANASVNDMDNHSNIGSGHSSIDPLGRAMVDAEIIPTTDGNILSPMIQTTEILADLSISRMIAEATNDNVELPVQQPPVMGHELKLVGKVKTETEMLDEFSISGLLVGASNDFVAVPVQQPPVTRHEVNIVHKAQMANEMIANVSISGLIAAAVDDIVEVPVLQLPETGHVVTIVHQPQGNQNDYKFRHESEKHHAMPIKGRLIPNNDMKTDPPYPEIHISNAPSCPAQVWVQCVEYNYDPNVHANPSPNPNGLFIKKGKEQYPPEGVAIIEDGERDGVVKLHINNLAENEGKITFEGGLQLALFRTKAKEVWNYLRTRNETNRTKTPGGMSRLTQIQIPENTNSKPAKKRIDDEIDTTRVKLCFQVFLYPDNPFPEVGELINALDPVCSEEIVDKHAHPLLQIDDISIEVSPETGLDKAIILCSKIEERDQNNMKIIFTFKDDKGEETEIQLPIPRSDVHHQYAIKFKVPAYSQVVKKLDLQSHAHAKVQLCKGSENKMEYSNPVDFIYFPAGNVGKLGKCIGAWKNALCKYAIKIEKQSEKPKGMPSAFNISKVTGQKNEVKGFQILPTYSLGCVIPPAELKNKVKRPHDKVGSTGRTEPDLTSDRNVQKAQNRDPPTTEIIRNILDMQED